MITEVTNENLNPFAVTVADLAKKNERLLNTFKIGNEERVKFILECIECP